ncbi:MAG TPA: amidohydrolase family protein [Nitrospinae bacterium]|jgi:cytosine/adenosine deaminase-related metal-dependent hydrolase|nr:amidohydrolase family protein [Nitrospinota bacterium]
MALKIKFGVLLTQCGEPIENGELIIEEGDIVAISSSPTEREAEETLDLSDHLLMPGFINAHSHLGLTALEKKLSPAKTFASWIGDLIPLNAALSDEERIRGIRMGADEMKASGVTGLADYVADPALLKSIVDLGFRSILFLETIGFQEDRAEVIADEVEAILKTHATKCNLGIAPHAPYSVSAKLWQYLDQLAKKYECLLSTHLAETDEEVQFIEKGGGPLVDLLKERQAFDMNWRVPGTTPTRYLKSLDVLSETVAVHCNFIDDDMDAVQAAVFCPKSTHWFGRTHILPVRKMLDAGIRVALGTDSLASNDSLNYLEEIRMADKLLPGVSRKEILMMATCFGGEILRLPCGKIESGQKADIIGFRIASQSKDWYDLPFERQRKKVDFYMLDGKF